MARDLEQRMAGNTEQRPATLADQIKSMESQFAMAAPKGAEASQLVRDALTCLRQNPKLAQCTPQSVLGGLMTCAQLGLRPGVLGHAYLLPFWDKRQGGQVAQLIIGYQGLIELAHRSGQIQSLIARTVYANDVFEVDYGLDDKLIHKPCMDRDKGQPVAYYAVAKFTTGGHAFFVMSHLEMLEYRDEHAKARNKQGQVFGPWADNFEAMAHKTCVRQLSKWMPKSTELATAIAADDTVRVDLTPDAINYAEHPEGGDEPEHIDGEIVDDEQPEAQTT